MRKSFMMLVMVMLGLIARPMSAYAQTGVSVTSIDELFSAIGASQHMFACITVEAAADPETSISTTVTCSKIITVDQWSVDGVLSGTVKIGVDMPYRAVPLSKV
ncbi:MAG: hypothetical protein WAW81_03395, partial [Minisyncoccia bacterium]